MLWVAIRRARWGVGSGTKAGVLAWCWVWAWMPVAWGTTAIQPTRLRCEDQENPTGIGTGRPRLSWTFAARGHDRRQTAYRILVSDSKEGLLAGRAELWDSGRVESADSTTVRYAGEPLVSNGVCYWKVRVWDEAGRESAWSEPARWETALLAESDWRADWIGTGPEREPRPPAGFFKSTNELARVTGRVEVDSRSVLLRREFRVSRPVRRARAFVTGLGYYEFFCNGRRVGDHVLAPAKSNYRRWVLYDTYDLTPYLVSGGNAVGMMLGNGWFNPTKKWWEPYRMQWFGSKRGRVQIHVEYEDGAVEVLGTDATWRTAPGPVLASCVYDGETYDAREESAGWDRAGFADGGWALARVMESPGGEMVAEPMPPVRVIEHLRPRSVSRPAPGVRVFDLGQNASGWVRLRARGPRGTRITVRYAEDVEAGGGLDVRSNERALSTDVYVMKGEGVEQYEPRFTFHGFRYVEITGYPGEPGLDDVLGCVVHTDCAPVGEFECSDELLNRIHRATWWSQRGAMMGYPMDCPQRDERLGWMGDAMVTAEEALLNFDAARFLGHWLDGVRRNQNPTNGDISIVSPRPYVPDEPDPTWSSAYPVMVWLLYVHRGDREFLARHYEGMERLVGYLGTQATNHILPRYWIGDWGSIVEGWKEGDPPSVTTAFYYLDTRIVEKAARVLGREADAERWGRLAGEIRSAFRRKYLDPGTLQFDQGTLFSNAFPLELGLAEEHERPVVLKHLLEGLERRGGSFDVGVLGAKHLVEALTEAGRPDVAYGLATRRGFPSWEHMLSRGQTTLSEFWDLKGSHNHVMMGSIDAWFYQTLAGIQPDEARPGFAHFRIRPYWPPTLNFVRAETETVRGRVRVVWERRRGGVRLRVVIPVNATATIRVPAEAGDRVKCFPSREPERREPGAASYEVGSGEYTFEVIPGDGRR